MQIPLPFSLRDDARINDFCDIGNENLLYHIRKLLDDRLDRLLYIWGPQGSGKTHLLQAITHEVYNIKNGLTGMYIPLAAKDIIQPENIDGLENLDIVCIDDIHLVAGNSQWQEALFGLFNAIYDNKHTVLVLTGITSSTGLQKFLPDLQSRLSHCTTFKINDLSDEAKIKIMQSKALKRGLKLHRSVAEFIINRSHRNLNELFEVLDKLDKASLAYKRRLTIPFVKEVIEL